MSHGGEATFLTVKLTSLGQGYDMPVDRTVYRSFTAAACGGRKKGDL